MFLEQKASGLYLGKKNSQKTFLVKIGGEGITQEILLELTKKECLYIQNTQGYKNFVSQVFDAGKLENILFYSKFLFNNIDVCNIILNRMPDVINKTLLEPLSGEEILFKQGKYIEGWLLNNFPKLFIYNSNHIEGSRIPQEEVEKIIDEKKYIYKIKNEIQEVENSVTAWKYLQNIFVFNVSHIKKLYHILTKNLLQETGIKYPRGFKKISVIVGIKSETTAPEHVVSEIKMLIQNYKDNKKSLFPLQLAFDFHLKYEQIHPFENGNGRTGRLLMNKILMQCDMVPMVVFTENKASYSHAIASCSNGRMKKYYTFMLEQYQKTLEKSYDIFPGDFQIFNTHLMQLKTYNSLQKGKIIF